jgi:hypothetical protein
MIDLALHQQLMKKWPGRVYADPKRIGSRVRHLEGLLPLLQGHRVIELGANAGIHALEIVKYAKYYIGFEPNPDYATQFRMTRDVAPPALREKMLFRQGTIMDYNPKQFAFSSPLALVVFVALYVIPANEIAYIEEKVLPECQTVIIQERRASRDKHGNTTNGLHTPKAIKKWLINAGFETWVYWHESGKLFEVVGRRV